MDAATAADHHTAVPPAPRPDHPAHVNHHAHVNNNNNNNNINNNNNNTHSHTNHAPITVPVNAPQMQPRRRTMLTSTSGDWALGKTIGAGSMGKVKLARHVVTGEQVAIKIIPRYSTEEHRNPRDMERADRSKEVRTAREAAIVTLLHHPYVCGMRDVVRTNYHWYMLFEYVNGGQMLDYIISHGKLKEKQARKFARQVASALDYCHRNSIVHRDLKIENILISKTGDIKIIDFGLSNLFNPASKLKTFCGSLYFAAPELLQARQYTGPEVDIWSFGIVLYVLVCGKVPFDDQSMPQLHAKIKRGQTEYPSSLTPDCRHLISRMLVTDPPQRATLHEVMNHPWMSKGYTGPPENYLPIREPLQLPLDPQIIQLMTGFDFGPPETIAAQLTKVIESEEYQSAVRAYHNQTATSATASGISSIANDPKKKSVFDFYKRRNSTSKDALSTASVEAIPLGQDPLNAFNPLISVYYLVKEKRDRDRAAAAAAIVASEHGSAASMPGVPSLPRNPGEQPLRMASSTATAVPDLSVSAPSPIREPESARMKPTGYNVAGDREPSNVATRNRPRARTHGDDEGPMTAERFLQLHAQQQLRREPASTSQTPQSQPQPQPAQQPETPHRKENVAVGLLRRFSTRKKLRVQTQTQPLQAQTPTKETSPAQPELLSPRGPTHRTSARELTRSASVSSADQRIRQPIPENGVAPEGTTTSDSTPPAAQAPEIDRDATPTSIRRNQSTKTTSTALGNTTSISAGGSGALPRRAHTFRARSLGNARRESIQLRRSRRSEANAREADLPEEPSTDVEGPRHVGRRGVDANASGGSSDRRGRSTNGPESHSSTTNDELAKPVYLKGLFSVSTTSTKSFSFIRADIKRVLGELGVQYSDIKGGFSCRKVPSIDLVQSPQVPTATSPADTTASNGNNNQQGHKHRISFAGIRQERGENDGPELKHSRSMRRHQGPPDRSFITNSEGSEEYVAHAPATGATNTSAHAAETTTRIRDDKNGNMVLKFEVLIVKVPLFTLHGIQFKKISGGMWQYKEMAKKILDELKL